MILYIYIYIQDNPIKFQKNYGLPDFNDIDGSLTELKEMQQILRDKYTKKSKDLDEEDYNSKRIDSKIYILFNLSRIISDEYYT